jgi:photosystem II stability/assembly factor-like uncharacterized protein
MIRILRLLPAIALFASAADAATTINGNTWFPVGPAPTTNGQAYGSPSRVDVGGRSGPIAVNPSNGNEIYLGTANGGVWHTTDGGTHWRPMSDQLEALAIGALVLDGCSAAACSRVFAGTGENAIRRDTYRGAGLYIGQETGGEFSEWVWTQKGANEFRNGSINNIILQGASTILVTLSSGQTASASESTVTAPAPPQGYGIYRSTDGGDHWSKLSVSGSNDAKPTSLVQDPQAADTLYAGFLGRGVFKSTNGGTSWCPLTPGINVGGCAAGNGLPNPTTTTFDFVELAIRHPAAQAAVLYASVGVCGDPITADCVAGIYRSDDNGSTWTQKQAPIASSSGIVGGCPRQYTRYTHVLKIDPGNANTVYLGGHSLCRSTDSGQNFSALGGLHPDQHDLAFAPTASRMFSSNDGGIYESPDGGTNWYSRNDDLQIVGFQSMSASPLSPAVVGGTQDNGTMLWVGTRVWRHIDDGDSASTLIDLDDPNRIFDLYVRQCPRRGGPMSSSFSDIFNGLGSTYSGCYTSFIYPEDAAFYPPMTQDPQAPHAIYIGTNKLYRTGNDGNQWDIVSPNLAGGGSFPDIRTGNVISAIGVSPSNHNIVYIGYYDGRIFVSDATTGPCPNASCWHESNTGATPDVPVSRIAVHPTMQNVAYASFSGFTSGAHLFKTTSTGGSWSAVGATLPSAKPVNTVTIEVNDPQRLWVGTDSGVYKSVDGGTGWTRFSDGLPNVPVYEIALDEVRGRAWAGTHGRGAFVLTKPLISNFEGWVNGGIWDIPVYGTGFLPNQNCTMQIIRQNGTTCASGSVDGDGGTIRTDDSGQLVTSKGAFYNGRAVVWGCLNGQCVGGGTVAACNQAGNPITSVIVSCGGGASVGIEHVTGCQQQNNPPQSVLGLDGLNGGGGGGGGGGVAPLPPGPNPPPPPAGAEQRAFYVVPTVQAGDGSTRALCSVRVTFTAGEARAVVIQRAADLINTNATCAASGVSARVTGVYPEPRGGGEDLPAYDPHLVISSPPVRGSQLMPAFQSDAGQATNLCFDVQGLGVATSGQLEITRVRFAAPPGGAAGGMIRLTEISDIGTCEIDVPTIAGQTATQIAAAVAAAFNTPGIPGPHLRCPANHNPRDVVQDGDSVLTVLPHGLRICIGDARVGLIVQPDELTHRYPVANAGGDRSVASTNVTLNGTLSTDPDSTPGTADGIVLYSWAEVRPDSSIVPLGNGPTVPVNLAEGLHHVTLRVTNTAGLSDTAVAAIHVGEGGGGGFGTSAVSASVFLSQAYARTNHGVLFGIPRHGTTDYRDVALRLRFTPTAHDAVVVQLRSQRRALDPRPLLRSDIDLDWGYYQHVFGSGLDVRAGRAPIPVGNWNALREVGTRLPFFAPPAAVYDDGALSETIDGIVVVWPTGGTLELAGYAGGSDVLEQVPGTADAARARGENTIGARASIEPVTHLRFGLAASRFSLRDGLMRVNASDRWTTLLFSIDASFPNWDVRAEYLASRHPQLLSGIAFPKVDSRGGYVEAGIAIIPKLWIHGQTEFRNGNFKRPAQPTLHVQLDRNYVLGADYLFTPNIVLKLEGHHDRGYLSQDQSLDVFVDPRAKIRYGILTLAVSF